MLRLLFAILILSGAGAVCAAVLTVAARLFAKEAGGGRAEEIRELLPGLNCGACGYAGCDGYSKALLHGEASVDLCTPGGEATTQALAEYFGICSNKNTLKYRAFVHCGGKQGVCQSDFRMIGGSYCAGKKLLFGGNTLCKSACLGCGDCAEVCPTDAIEIKDECATVDQNRCIGCGLCVEECPRTLIELIPLGICAAVRCSSHERGGNVREKCVVGCIACKKCENTCNWEAVKVVDRLAVINSEKCTCCGECAAVCPVGCIIMPDQMKK